MKKKWPFLHSWKPCILSFLTFLFSFGYFWKRVSCGSGSLWTCHVDQVALKVTAILLHSLSQLRWLAWSIMPGEPFLSFTQTCNLKTLILGKYHLFKKIMNQIQCYECMKLSQWSLLFYMSDKILITFFKDIELNTHPHISSPTHIFLYSVIYLRAFQF